MLPVYAPDLGDTMAGTPKEKEKVRQLVHRLEDLLVEEVSAVDLAANQRTIVVMKRQEEPMLGQDIHEEAASWTVDVAKEDEPEAQAQVEAEVEVEAQEGCEAAVWTTAFVNDLPDTAFLYIAPGGTKDAEDKTVPRSLRYFPVRDETGELDRPHVMNALARIPQADIPQEAKDEARLQAEALLEELAAEEAPEEAEEAAAGEEKAAEAPQEPAEAEASQEKAVDEAVVSEAVKLLQVALGRMVSGESLDAEAHDAVARARELLSRGVTPPPVEPQSDEEAGETGEEMAKAGAKMAASRRARFKDALDALVKIFEDILPAAEKETWPRSPAKKAEEPALEAVEEPPASEEATALAQELVKAREELAATTAVLAKAQAETQALRVERAKLAEQALPSRLLPVGGAPAAESFCWGFDLNDDPS